MNRPFGHWLVTLYSQLVVALLMLPAPASAQNISCSAVTMSNLVFGNVDPMSSLTTANAILTYTCKNTAGSTRSATLCFSIGEPTGGQTNPRLLRNGASTLQFQLFQNAAHSIVWGSQFFGTFLTPFQVNVTIGAGGSTGLLNATMYGQVLSGQTATIPGVYSDNYGNADTALTINEVGGATAPGNCAGGSSASFGGFLVSATVIKNCTVTATNLQLGGGTGVDAFSAVGTSGSSSLSVTCSNKIPYNIALQSGNNPSTAGLGTLKGSIGGNADTLSYQLYSNAALSNVWGNSGVTATATGNGVHGIGNGATQTSNVYAKVTAALPTAVTPDSYSDTVTVLVYY